MPTAFLSYAMERTREYEALAIASPAEQEGRSGVFVIRLPEGCDALSGP